jgi:hypothetical protein
MLKDKIYLEIRRIMIIFEVGKAQDTDSATVCGGRA